MNNIFSEWQQQWILPPNDLSEGTPQLPSLLDWIDKNWEPQDITSIVDYLRDSPMFTRALSPEKFRCVLCGQDLGDGTIWKSDGFWVWPQELAHLVEDHHLRLPDRMVEHIRKQSYLPPAQDNCNFEEASKLYSEAIAVLLASAGSE